MSKTCQTRAYRTYRTKAHTSSSPSSLSPSLLSTIRTIRKSLFRVYFHKTNSQDTPRGATLLKRILSNNSEQYTNNAQIHYFSLLNAGTTHHSLAYPTRRDACRVYVQTHSFSGPQRGLISISPGDWLVNRSMAIDGCSRPQPRNRNRDTLSTVHCSTLSSPAATARKRSIGHNLQLMQLYRIW